jgi:hypothetical protein
MLTLAAVGNDVLLPTAGRKVLEWFDDDGEVSLRAFAGADLRWIDCPRFGVFAFSPGSREVRVWPEAGIQYEAIVDTFDMLQPVILQALGWQALHASAAIGPAGVLAFCGNHGSGKSTLAFAMHRAGWQQFADDALVLRLDGGHQKACPLPFRPRLRRASRAYFIQGNGSLPSFPRSQSADVPLAAIFILRQDAGLSRPHVSRTPQARAFSDVLAHAHCYDSENPTHMRQLVDDYLGLVGSVPVFNLAYPPDLRQLPRLTRAVMVAVANFDSAAASISSELRPAVVVPRSC